MEDLDAYIADAFTEALRKLKEAMESGPFGDNITLTPTEATLIYRLITRK